MSNKSLAIHNAAQTLRAFLSDQGVVASRIWRHRNGMGLFLMAETTDGRRAACAVVL